jgi:hypothetical protein
MLAISLQAAGAAVVALGVALVYVPAGIVTVGAFAIAFGVSIARES